MKKLIIFCLLGSLIACSGYRPIVDMQGKSQNQYEADLRDCQQYAKQVSPAKNTAAGVGIGAVIGTGLGALFGAFTGNVGEGAAMGAAAGGAGGGLGGAESGIRAQKKIISRCMQGRGWNVLN